MQFFDSYMEYVSNAKEVPKLYHLWCAVSVVGTSLGKNFWAERGHYDVYPNLYIMLFGAPGTGKGTAISILQKLIVDSGYTTIAADRSSKEKFLLDFHNGFSFDDEEMHRANEVSLLDMLGESSYALQGDERKSAEVYIIAEEFTDFIGTTNSDFVSLLTKLWSFTTVYKNRLKNSKSVFISNPCVNIIGGTTASNFSMAFPPEIATGGFLARFLPIYGEPTGIKDTFPEPLNRELGSELASLLRRIKQEVTGLARISGEARTMLDRINREWEPIKDPRFQHYATRRFTQLMKLCLIYAAADFTTEILPVHVKAANTLLTHTEELMPKAVGEFGKARNSDVTSKIMEALYVSDKPISLTELWKLCSPDLDNITQLAGIMQGLAQAEKIQGTSKGWLPKMAVKRVNLEVVDGGFNQRLKGGL
jgi:hypothetical protein